MIKRTNNYYCNVVDVLHSYNVKFLIGGLKLVWLCIEITIENLRYL